MAIEGLEIIIRRGIIALSMAGMLTLNACIRPATVPTRTLPPPILYTSSFTPAYTATQAYTPAPTQTSEPTLTQTFAPTQTLTSIPTETPTITLTPTQTCEGERKIVVDLSEQMIYAVLDYDCTGERVFVNSSLVSTGTDAHPTPIGEYSIWIKLESTTMSGPGYYLENVPYTMYFTEEGHGIHGTYWHDNFGTPMSHGCVNLPNDMAEWFFYWADVGTKVIVQP